MKLSPWTIYIIGGSVAVLPIAYGFFYQFLPKQQEADMVEKTVGELKAVAEKFPDAKKKVDQALQKANASASEWQAIALTRTPPTTVSQGGINLAVDAWHLSVDTKAFRNSMQIAVNKQMLKGGVKVINGPVVEGIGDDTPVGTILSSFYNFPQPYAFPVVIRDLGTVTVQGTLAQIEANMRSWANMPHYLAVADGLSLTGTSPTLTGTYNVTIVGFIRAHDVFPNVPELSGGGGGARGAGFGGFGGPGGPPGMPGGMGMPGMPGGPRGAAGARGPGTMGAG